MSAILLIFGRLWRWTGFFLSWSYFLKDTDWELLLVLALHFSFCLFHYSNMTQISQQKVQSYPPTVSCIGLFSSTSALCLNICWQPKVKQSWGEAELQCTEKINESEPCVWRRKRCVLFVLSQAWEWYSINNDAASVTTQVRLLTANHNTCSEQVSGVRTPSVSEKPSSFLWAPEHPGTALCTRLKWSIRVTRTAEFNSIWPPPFRKKLEGEKQFRIRVLKLFKTLFKILPLFCSLAEEFVSCFCASCPRPKFGCDPLN